jgi:hypothetical protein
MTREPPGAGGIAGRMRALPLLPLALLAACASEPPAPPSGAWIGRSEAELVGALGVPTRVYEAGGSRFLAYERAGTAAPAVVPSFGFGVGRASGGWGSATGFGTGLGLSFGPFGAAGPCTTSYELRDGRVVNALRQGPGCA